MCDWLVDWLCDWVFCRLKQIRSIGSYRGLFFSRGWLEFTVFGFLMFLSRVWWWIFLLVSKIWKWQVQSYWARAPRPINYSRLIFCAEVSPFRYIILGIFVDFCILTLFFENKLSYLLSFFTTNYLFVKKNVCEHKCDPRDVDSAGTTNWDSRSLVAISWPRTSSSNVLSWLINFFPAVH